MFDLSSFVKENLIASIQNRSIGKEHANVLAANYLIKGILTEEDVIEIAVVQILEPEPEMTNEEALDDAEIEPIEETDTKVAEAPEPEIAETEAEAEPEEAEAADDTVEETIDLSTLTVVELKALAKEARITGYSSMLKDELIEALEALQTPSDEAGEEATTEDTGGPGAEGEEDAPKDDE